MNDTTGILNGDPKYIGPGTWFSLHILSKNATTDESKTLFKKFLYTLKDKFPCEKCRFHIAEYLENNPVDLYWNITENGIDIGMFKYGWNFHNTVNQRLGKQQVQWKVAYSLYYNQKQMGVCGAGCGDTSKTHHSKNDKNEKNTSHNTHTQNNKNNQHTNLQKVTNSHNSPNSHNSQNSNNSHNSHDSHDSHNSRDSNNNNNNTKRQKSQEQKKIKSTNNGKSTNQQKNPSTSKNPSNITLVNSQYF